MNKPDQFYHPIEFADIMKANHESIAREKAIRLYCDQAGRMWALQVRSPASLANGREGKDFLVATAKLDREALKALRDACNEMLDYYAGYEAA